MPRNLMLAGAASLALALTACGQQADEMDAGAPAETMAPDANPSATLATPANEAAAPDFVMKAAASDMYELESSRLAQEKAQNAELKAFATQMIADHTKSTNDLKAAIAQANLNLQMPAAMPQDMQEKITALQNATGAEFDRLYAEQQVEAHQNALNLMSRYAQDGDTPALQTFASNTAPVIQRHFDMITRLRDQMRNAGTAAN